VIDQGILDTVRSAVCGVGRFLAHPDHIQTDPTHPRLEIIGTGFLIDNTTVITNRHVVQDLHKLIKGRRIPPSWEFLHFVYPTLAGWQAAYQKIRGEGIVHHALLDIAFLEFDRPQAPGFEKCQPQDFGDLALLRVSQPVAAVGYPHGEDLLMRGKEQYRFGPVLQRGYISAISPLDNVPGGAVEELLLDLRAAEGMSGSPIFIPASGKVVGMLTSGWVGSRLVTTSNAIPIGANEAGDLLAEYKRAKG